jgi:methionyl-tRNA formyltransferase
LVRAYDPWPVAFTEFKGEEVRVYRAAVERDSQSVAPPPGTIVEVKRAPLVQCGAGRLLLLEVQAAGRKRMKGEDFGRGRRLAIGDRFGDQGSDNRD